MYPTRNRTTDESSGKTCSILPVRGARRAGGLTLWGWAIAIQIGGAAATGALQAQTCTCSGGPIPGVPETVDSIPVASGDEDGDRKWWMFLLPAGAAGLIAGLPGGGKVVPARGTPVLIESGGEVALPPVGQPDIAAPPAVPLIEPKVKSDKRIPVGKDGKPKPVDTARAADEPQPEPTVPAPFLLGGLGLGAGAWTVLLKGTGVKQRLIDALRALV